MFDSVFGMSFGQGYFFLHLKKPRGAYMIEINVIYL